MRRHDSGFTHALLSFTAKTSDLSSSFTRLKWLIDHNGFSKQLLQPF